MQRLDQDGSGNIGVQIDGDHNAVTIHSGAARLTLALRHKAGRPGNGVDSIVTRSPSRAITRCW